MDQFNINNHLSDGDSLQWLALPDASENALDVEVQVRQQAVHWRAVLEPSEVPMQLNPHEHIAGFTDRWKAEDWIAARLRMDGWHYTLEPLYASQPSVQDVSVLVEALEAIVRQYPNPDITHVDYRVQVCKQAEHALEVYRATLAAQAP